MAPAQPQEPDPPDDRGPDGHGLCLGDAGRSSEGRGHRHFLPQEARRGILGLGVPRHKRTHGRELHVLETPSDRPQHARQLRPLHRGLP